MTVTEFKLKEGGRLTYHGTAMRLKPRLLCPLLIGCVLSLSELSALTPVQGGDQVLSPRQVLENIEAKKYSGRRIDLISSKAGLQDVMTDLEKAGGLRLELDPSINDRVTYRMLDVPWDEALAAVLADNSLNISLNLEGTGFKIGRGERVVLALSNRGRAKFILFLYKYLVHIAAGIVLLSALGAGLWFFLRRRARKRTAEKRALLPPNSAELVKNKLVRLLKDERLYRDEDLSLQSLAERLAVSPHQLSWVINEELRVSFASLVNGYRAEEVKSRLADPSLNGSSILRAAMEAGFNSKASFNRAFKAHTGMTPSQYKRNLSG